MATQTQKQQTEQPASEQIHQRASDEVQRLQSQRAEIIEQIGTATQALTAIPQARQARQARLSEAKASVKRLDAHLAQATHYAKVSHGTASEASAIKEVSEHQKQLSDAKKVLEATEHEVTRDDNADAAKEQELTATLTQFRSDKERTDAELSNAEATHRRAHSELGREKFGAIAAEDDELRANVADKENQRLAAQIRHHDFYERSLNELKDWPDLQQELRKCQAPENATLLALRGAVGYIDTLLATGHDLIDRFPPQVPSAYPSYNYVSWWKALGVSFDQELAGAHGIAGAGTMLRSHRANLVKIADEYQTYLASTGQ